MDSSPLPLFILLQSLVNPPTTAVIIANVIVLVLIFCSALMSASEVAFFSLTRPEVDALHESDNTADQRIAALLEKPRYLLSTMLVSNNLANIGVVIISYFITREMFNFHDIAIGGFVIHDYAIEFLWNVIIVTFFLVLFGEATPKVYATHNKLKIARLMVGVFQVLVRVLAPVNYLLVNSTKGLEKRLKRHNTEIDRDEINKAIEITVEKKESKQDASLLKGIVHFGNTTVKQVMRPRTEVAALDYDLNFTEVMEKVKELGYSRFPVYKETLDSIAGVLNVKDLLEHLNQDETFGWQSLIRKPFFVPENKMIDDLLREIQANRKHLAIVVDEYGGTSGIITLEDIIEEVVGDIKDEFDENTDGDFKKLDDRNFIFEGKTSMNDVCRLMEVDPSAFDEARGEAETLGGLILELTGRIPRNGFEVRSGNYKFTILNVANNRIERVKVTNEAP